MYYEIVEEGTHKESGHAYFLVRYWLDQASHDKGAAPVLVEDFLMQLRPSYQRATEVDKDGNVLATETVEYTAEELQAKVRTNIENRWMRAVLRGETGDKSTVKFAEHDKSDPRGVRSKLSTLEGSKSSFSVQGERA